MSTITRRPTINPKPINAPKSLEEVNQIADNKPFEFASGRWQKQMITHINNLQMLVYDLTAAVNKQVGAANYQKKANPPRKKKAMEALTAIKLEVDQMLYNSGAMKEVGKAYNAEVEYKKNYFTTDWDFACKKVEKMGYDNVEIFNTEWEGQTVYSIHRVRDNKLVLLDNKAEPVNYSDFIPIPFVSKYNRKYVPRHDHDKNNQMGQTKGVFLLPSLKAYHERKKAKKERIAKKKLAIEQSKLAMTMYDMTIYD